MNSFIIIYLCVLYFLISVHADSFGFFTGVSPLLQDVARLDANDDGLYQRCGSQYLQHAVIGGGVRANANTQSGWIDFARARPSYETTAQPQLVQYGTNMTTDPRGCEAVTVNNTVILVGGTKQNGNLDKQTNEFRIETPMGLGNDCDGAYTVFHRQDEISNGRRRAGVAAYGDYAFVCMGQDGSIGAMPPNAASPRWDYYHEPTAVWRFESVSSTARFGGAATTVRDLVIYAGGFVNNGNERATVTIINVTQAIQAGSGTALSLAAGQVTPEPSLGSARGFLSACTVGDRYAVFGGGAHQPGTPPNNNWKPDNFGADIDVYDVVTDSWAYNPNGVQLSAPRMNIPVTCHANAAIFYGGQGCNQCGGSMNDYRGGHYAVDIFVPAQSLMLSAQYLLVPVITPVPLTFRQGRRDIVAIAYGTPGPCFPGDPCLQDLSNFQRGTDNLFQLYEYNNTAIVPDLCTAAPTLSPTLAPTKAPSKAPTKAPTQAPTRAPSRAPTKAPTRAPTRAPTLQPTKAPSKVPTRSPSLSPSVAPTHVPSNAPTLSPTVAPSRAPSKAPTVSPTVAPTKPPTTSPSASPTTSPSRAPSRSPTANPTRAPSRSPTMQPTVPDGSPSRAPTLRPTRAPSTTPTRAPSATPSVSPTDSPTKRPSVAPTQATVEAATTAFLSSMPAVTGTTISNAVSQTSNVQITGTAGTGAATATTPNNAAPTSQGASTPPTPTPGNGGVPTPKPPTAAPAQTPTASPSDVTDNNMSGAPIMGGLGDNTVLIIAAAGGGFCCLLVLCLFVMLIVFRRRSKRAEARVSSFAGTEMRGGVRRGESRRALGSSRTSRPGSRGISRRGSRSGISRSADRKLGGSIYVKAPPRNSAVAEAAAGAYGSLDLSMPGEPTGIYSAANPNTGIYSPANPL